MTNALNLIIFAALSVAAVLFAIILHDTAQMQKAINQKECEIQQLDHEVEKLKKELRCMGYTKDMYQDFDDTK